jgi:hypothetical protein
MSYLFGGARRARKSYKKSAKAERKCREQGHLNCVGNKRSVFLGYAKQTPGGIKKDGIISRTDKHGNRRFVFKSRHAQGKKSIRHLLNAGYQTRKGSFQLFSRRSSRRR